MRLFYVCAENKMPIANWTELYMDPVLWYKRVLIEGLASCAGSKLSNQKITAVRYEEIIPVQMLTVLPYRVQGRVTDAFKTENPLCVPRSCNSTLAKGFASEIDMINTEQLKRNLLF